MHPAPEFRLGRPLTAARILLLEDDADFAGLVRANMERATWGELSLEHTATLCDALARLERGGIDLVITDLNLPDSKGLETLDSLVRATDRPILVLSGERNEGLREAAIGCGAYDFMSKDRLDGAELERLVRFAMQANAFRSLRESEERFRSLTELYTDWYWEQDTEFRFIRFDGRMAELQGHGPNDVLGYRRWEMPSIMPLSCTWEEHRATLAAGQAFRDFEYSRVLADGSVRYVTVAGAPMHDAQGRFTGYRGIATDITARRSAEDDQRASRQLLDNIVENIPTAVQLKSVQNGYRVVMWNKAAEAMYALPREEAIGRNAHDLWPKESADLMHAADCELVEKGGMQEFPDRLALTKDRGTIRVHMRKVPLFDAAGKASHLLVVADDMTASLVDAARLRESEARFRSLVQLSSDWYWETDAEMRYTAVKGANLFDAEARLLGTRREDLPGIDFGSAIWQPYYDAVAARRSFRDFVYPRVLASGETHYISLSGEPLLDESGAFKGYRGVGKNVTARKREERLLSLEHSISRRLADAKTSGEGLRNVMGAICESENWECGRYFQVDEGAGLLRFAEAWTSGGAAIQRFVEHFRTALFKKGEGLVGRVWESGEPLWVEDTSRDPRVALKKLADDAGLRGALLFPVAFEGRVTGVFAISSCQVRKPDERLLETMRVIGSQIGQFLQRKHAQEDLRRFRLALDNSADMIALVDRATMRYVDVNETACKLLGYSREEMLSMGPQDVLPLSRGDLEKRYDELIATPSLESGRNMNMSYRCKDGSLLPFEYTRRVLRSGDTYIIAAIARDIRKRIAADEALSESEERFRSLSALSSDMFWEQDDQYRFTSFSGADKATLPQRRFNSVLGKRRWETTYFSMSETDWAAHKATLEARQPFRDLELGRFSDAGAKVWVSVSGEPVFDPSGAFTGYRGVGKDISERKREEQMQALEQTVNRNLAEADNATEALTAAIRAVCESEGWECGRYFGMDADAGVLRFGESWGVPEPAIQEIIERSRGVVYEPGEGLIGKVWQSGEPLWVADPDRDPRARRKIFKATLGIRCAFIFPVKLGGKTMGVLAFDSRESREAEERLLQAIHVIGGQIGQFLQRKQAEDDLRRFRAGLDSSADMVFLVDSRDAKLLDFNDTACRYLGYTRAELLGRTADVLRVDRSSEQLVDEYRGMTAAGRIETAITTYRRKDGSTFPVEMRRQMLHTAKGPMLVVNSRDLTERRRAESALSESEARFRQTFELAATGMAQVGLDGRLLRVNRGLCAILGYAEEELVGRRMADVSHPEDHQVGEVAGLPRVRAGEQQSCGFEKRYLRKDGSSVWVNVNVALSHDAQGEPQYEIAVFEDITERKRAEERQAVHLRYQEKLARFGESALGKREATELIGEAVRSVHEALRVNVVAYVELGAGERELIVRSVTGLASGDRDISAAAAFGSADAVALALEQGELAVVDGAARALPFDWAAPFPFATLVPVHGDQRVQGALCALSGAAGALGQEESKFLATAASVLSAGLQRIGSEGRLAFLAQFDPLTGLPNRALLSDRFSQMIVQARRHSTQLGVLFIDLDDFKLVNDSLGHAGGDELLVETAQRLQASVRSGDTVARISGDEFAVILGDLARPDDAALVAQKIIDRLAAPVTVRGQEVFVTASIGIAAFPADGDDAEALLGAADAAMYRAKQAGRNGYQFFTADINNRTRARAQVGSELRHALEREEFALVYQPKFDLRTGRPCAVEALLRWKHPARGTVSPVEFIPVLEETGLIVQVGEWVLRRACADLKAWKAAGLPAMPVAVNLSARQFRQQDLEARILAIVNEAGVDPKLIELEITESQLMQDPDHATRVMLALSKTGIRLAIDDFGTGYSSLSYLTRFPVTALKIDRSFVADVLEDQADAAIVRTIIDMAHTLGFIVVAEGVETEAQALLLRGLGCEQAQGYFFARPMPEAELRTLILSFGSESARQQQVRAKR